MGRWIIMLVASLFGAIPFFRRLRERRARGGSPGSPRSERPPLLPPAESAKLAPIWDGFADLVAGLAGPEPERGTPIGSPTALPRRSAGSGKSGLWIPVKLATPWILAVVVALGMVAPPGSSTRACVVLAGVSGIVGWGTSWFALWLLFWPTRPRFGFGVIPANRAALVDRLSEAIERHLVNPDLIAAWLAERGIVSDLIASFHGAVSRVLTSTEFRDGLRTRLGATGRLYLDDPSFRATIGARLTEAARGIIRSKLWKVVADIVEKPLVERLKSDIESALVSHGSEILDSALPGIDGWIDRFSDSLEGSLADVEAVVSEQIVAGLRRLDIRGLVTSRLTTFEEGQLETLLRSAVLNELAAVEVIGGVLGMVTGLLIPLLL